MTSTGGQARIRIPNARVSRRIGHFLPWLMIALMLAGVPVTALSATGAKSHSNDEILVYPLPIEHYEPSLQVSGLAWSQVVLDIKLDGRTVATTRANERGDFVASIRLKPGWNKLEIAGAGNQEKQARSETFDIHYQGTTGGSEGLAKTSNLKFSPDAPVLDQPPSPASENPVTVSGTAESNTTVSFFVNGRYTRSILIDSTETFATWVPLDDGMNSIYAVAEDSSGQSPASNTVDVSYTNNLSRDVGGTLTETVVWTAGDGTPYTLNQSLVVAPGVTLWLQPGVEISIPDDYRVEVDGELVVRGTDVDLVKFSPSTAACDGTSTKRSDWQGVRVDDGGLISIDYGEIHCAAKGVYFWKGDGSIKHTQILNNNIGIEMRSTSPANVTTPEVVAGNEIRGSWRGIYVRENAQPLISNGNEITANDYGIYVWGDYQDFDENPILVVTHNSLYGNASYDYYATQFYPYNAVFLDASRNWWGTTDPAQIAQNIYDWTDNPYDDSPVIDYSEYLDGPGGSPVYTGETLNGPITADETLSAANYLVLGRVGVGSSATLTLNAGTNIDVSGSHQLRVKGTLSVEGSDGSPVIFRPTTPACDGVSTERSDWGGIRIDNGGVASIEYAEIHCANRGVYFLNGDGSVRHTQLLNNKTGIEIKSTIPDLIIAPQITDGNVIRGSWRGFRIWEGSEPLISGGNEITENDYGVHVWGDYQDSSRGPWPIVTGNSLYGNTNYDYYANNFHPTAERILDASYNWWGTTDPSVIASTIFDIDDDDDGSAPIVDYDYFLEGPGGSPALAIADFKVEVGSIQALADETVQGHYVLTKPGSVTLRIDRHSDGVAVYESTESYPTDGQYAFQWNGKDNSGNAVSPGLYRVVLIASDGADTFTFNPTTPRCNPSVSGAVPSSYGPFRNDNYKIDVNMRCTGLLDMEVTRPDGTSFWVFEDKFYVSGEHWVHWDGRDTDGDIFTDAVDIYYPVPKTRRPNHVKVQEQKPRIVGTGAVPDIEVKSNPYLMRHSYEQVSHIGYRIDLDSWVTVKLLPPGIYDPSHASAITMLDGELQQAFDASGAPVDHVVDWTGYLDSAPNDLLSAAEGAFTFTIEAESQVSGQSSIYRGVLNIRR